MRVFYDLEFVERGNQLPLQLISGAYVAEDGRELYVINEECISNVMRDPWLSINVAPSLPISLDQSGPGNFITQWDPKNPEYDNVFSMDALVDQVKAFLLSCCKDSKLELWAYYGAYDHVVHSQLFGRMVDLPAEFPMWTHELMQEIERDPDMVLPAQPSPAHHALQDARWNRDVFLVLNGDITAAQLAKQAAAATSVPVRVTEDDLLPSID